MRACVGHGLAFRCGVGWLVAAAAAAAAYLSQLPDLRTLSATRGAGRSRQSESSDFPSSVDRQKQHKTKVAAQLLFSAGGEARSQIDPRCAMGGRLLARSPSPLCHVRGPGFALKTRQHSLRPNGIPFY